MTDDIRTPSKPQGAPGIVVLMLGLYLIILAFFILLNAISTFDEERQKKAAESVAVGFGFEAQQVTERPDNDEEISIFKIYESIAREIQGTLESYLPVKDYKVELNDNQVVVRLSTPAFFEPGRVALNPVQVEFFQDMAGLLSRDRVGVRLTSEVRVKGSPADMGADTTMPLPELAGRRAAVFTRALMERGVLPVTTSASALEDSRQEIILFVYINLVNARAAASALSRQGDR
jgi:flagellar motor protein MotB